MRPMKTEGRARQTWHVLIAASVLGAAASLSSPASAQVKLPLQEQLDAQKTAHADVIQRRKEVATSYSQRLSTDPQQTVIYGTDSRRDVYQLTESDLISYQQAAAVVVNASELTDNGNGTYTLGVVPWLTQGGTTVCPTEPFRGQSLIGFCSGFLVGSDLIVSAGHCIAAGDVGTVAYVFGFDQQSAAVGPNTIVSADNVYFITTILADVVNSGTGQDHSLVRVDRPVVGRTPLPVRRSGTVAAGTPLVMIGHPTTLPKKIDDGGVVQNSATVGFFTSNVDAYGGNSGSMVINRLTGQIEGILVRGNADYETVGGCVRSRVCPDTGCSGTFEEISKIEAIASLIPDLGLSVSPGAGPLSVGVVGGPFTNLTVAYTLGNPTTASVDYSVAVVTGASLLTINGGSGPISGTLPPGGSAIVVADLTPAVNALVAGFYNSTIEFTDVTNARTFQRTQSIEVGTTGFTMTPASGFSTGGPVGGPFPGNITYVLTSNRPTPVTVNITPSQPWVSINGVEGPTSVVISGNGATDNVMVGIGPSGLSLTSGLRTATVAFDNLTGTGSTSRNIALDVGRFAFSSTDTPIVILDGSSTTPSVRTSIINIPVSTCVTDLDVDMDISHTFKGDLIVELRSPAGTTVRLHNRTGGSTDNIVGTYDQSATLVPDGPGSLSDFNGETPLGNWILTVSDNDAIDSGMLNGWAIKLQVGTCPPARVTVFSVDMNSSPGWTTSGLWQFGRPTGAGGDPSAGFTGLNVYGWNLAGAYANNIAATNYLTTTPFDLSGVQSPRLEFRRWLGVERSLFDRVNLQYSINNTTWTTLYANPDATIIDTSWQVARFDLPLAANQTAVRVRWGLGPTDSSVIHSGWNIDDVAITGFRSCAVDFNADGFLNQEDLGGFLTAFLDESVPAGPSGTSSAPCPGEPAPHDTLGYAADYNRDCSFNQEDLSGFLTEYFTETENPASCIAG